MTRKEFLDALDEFKDRMERGEMWHDEKVERLAYLEKQLRSVAENLPDTEPGESGGWHPNVPDWFKYKAPT